LSQRVFSTKTLCACFGGRENAMVRHLEVSIRARARLHQTNIMVANTDVLNSWKEVATYLGRGIRTVQRWERELGLPIRRPRGKLRSPIIAFRPELDQWLQNAPMAQRLDPAERQTSSSSLQEAA